MNFEFTKKVIRRIFSVFPTRKYVFFESKPDFSDNTKSVFNEMLLRGLNNKYKLVWRVSDKNKRFPEYKNVKFVDNRTIFNKAEYAYYTLFAKCIITCNEIMPSNSKKQVSFYLTHGTPIKKLRGKYTIPTRVNYACIASEKTKELMAYEFSYDINKIYAFGFPRNDTLIDTKLKFNEVFEESFSKIIVWYPTYRKHKGGTNNVTKNSLPVLHNSEQATMLNEFLSKLDVLLVLKPHFVQDVSYIKDYNLSNIKFIDDSFFEKNNITSYEFVGSCDALITDYSSIYFDYLLADKPIAVVWEDIEEYRQNQGFAIDVDYYLKGAEKIYNIEDFKNFIMNVANGIDNLKSERKEINEWANYSNDGQNSKRVVDFIIEKANLK